MRPEVLHQRIVAAKPSGRWQLTGFRIIGLCPFHDDRAPSFHVYLDRGYAKCYGCDKYISNPIALWAGIRGISHHDALQELRQYFGLKFLAASIQSGLQEWERSQHLKRRVMAICHEELIGAVSAPESDEYSYAADAARWLLETRQVPKDALPSLPMIGVMPAVAKILNALEEEYRVEEARIEEMREEGAKKEKPHPYHEDAAAYLKDAAGAKGSVVFRLDLAPDTIGRLKVRRPYMPSSDCRFLEDAFEEELGFFGLGWELYRPLLGGGAQAKYVEGVYVVEGEFDALSIMARQVLDGGPTFVTVAVGGNSQSGAIDNLRSAGFRKAFLFADRPGEKKGDRLIKAWLEAVKHLRGYVFTGWEALPGNADDPDSAVVAVGLAALRRILLDTENRLYFQSPPDWVFAQAEADVTSVPERDVRGRIEAASGWGRLLKNSIDCDLFVDACAGTYGLPSGLLKREIVAREEDEPAFILRLVDVLTREFYPIGQRSQDRDRRLFLWHRERREIVSLGLADDASIERELGSKLGPSYQFFQDKVGLPTFLEVPDVVQEQGKYLQKLDRDLRWYNRQALTIISQSVPDYDAAPQLGQGIHVLRNEEGGPPKLYVVNGRDIYHGSYGDQGRLSWAKLEGPAHEGYLFDVGEHRPEKAWLSSIRRVEDFERAKEIEPKSLWERLHQVLDLGWLFKNHALSVDFLAAHLLATTVNNAFRRQVVVTFNADSSSGKSKLNLGLIAGHEIKSLHLIEAAVGMQSFTPAGIRMTMNKKVRPLCLDEFEDENSAEKKAKYVQETLEMLRNLTGEVNTFTMGSRSNEAVQYNMRFFVFLSAINPTRKIQDANRMVVLNMDKKEGRDAPEEIIPRELGWNFIADLRADLSIGLLPHVGKLQSLYEEIEREFGKPGAKPANIDQRYFQALFPAMSVMKLVGQDYRKFAHEFCGVARATFAGGTDNSDSAQLFNWLIQTAEIRYTEDRSERQANAVQLLSTGEWAKMNSSPAGLFFDEATDLLIVNWTMAVQRLLARHPRYGKEGNVANLRDLANRSPYAVKAEELLSSGALERLRTLGLTAMAPTGLSAFRVGHLVRGLAASPEVGEARTSRMPRGQEDESDAGDFTR